jgi:HD-like signal output (HDOD) protein
MGLVGLLAVGALLFLFLINRKSSDAAARISTLPEFPPQTPRPGAVAAPAPEPAAAAALVRRQAPPVPAALQDFVWRRADELPTARRQALLAGLRRTPPPSRAFHQLVSPQFVARASSVELSELVIGEPQVAAKVLARVNSSAYGLQTPVSSIGQAVTFLGLNSVRSICLQYMLSAAFKADTPTQQRRFDAIWFASAVASELCFKLAQQLRLPDPGAMVTEVVLAFLGHFAATARMPAAPDAAGSHSLLARAQAQQAQLGVPAAEIGGLLLHEWALPAGLIAEVVDIDRLLVTPPEGLETGRAASLAVCYLSARLGEQLARGEALDLASFDPRGQTDPDYFQLGAYLDTVPQLARLPDVLHGPELIRALQGMLSGLRKPA